MMANLWFFCALGTAILWGFSYALSEKVMKDGISPTFIMVTTGFFYCVMSIIIAYLTDSFKGGFEIITNSRMALINLMLMALAFVAGSFLIYYAISLKNATMVNLIEITYPIFTLIFAYIILKEVQITPATLVGGLLIFSGISIIYLKA